MKTILTTTFLAAGFSTVAQAADKYVLDASHSQILFSYNHLGYSTTFGMFSGFEGDIVFDQDNPANSSVSVSMPVKSMFTGWEQRDGYFMSAEFFNATDEDLVTFTSTAIEITGDETAMITGDLSMNGITKSVVLDAKLNQVGTHPIEQKDWAGFDATTTLLRTDFGVGQFEPFISNEVEVRISVEAMKVE